jgi:hypothetical protein
LPGRMIDNFILKTLVTLAYRATATTGVGSSFYKHRRIKRH